MTTLLTLPNNGEATLSIRAKALLFHDPLSQDLLQHIERVARSDATALIIGETGTGKELVARHIHACSGRRGPFIAVNCGAFSESLIDSELFGHETGAFTGATQGRAGWFEAANGGTLFLDEIGDLPKSLQVKLLRVLQERQVVRLGSRKAVPLDVRLVAATNVDLQKAVAADRFRTDLYYRLSVAPINLPPLYQRPGDILPLAEHFLQRYARTMGLTDIGLSADARAALLAYEWPGNIRELENAIHYALIVCAGNTVCAADLNLAGATHRRQPVPEAQAALSAPGSAGALRGGPPLTRLEGVIEDLIQEGTQDLYAKLEETLVRTAFAWCDHNQVQTARVLGVTRNIVRTQLKRFGMIEREHDLAADAGQLAAGVA
jgi:sigma-54-specific transcriptional regulator